MSSPVAVAGAGTMGSQVAYVAARSGRQVILLDNDPAALDAARRRVAEAARMERLIRPRSPAGIAPDASMVDTALDRVQFTLCVDDLAPASFLVENIIEDVGAKRALYRQLARVCPSPCILAANTSAIPITRLASFVDDPARVIGIHFMNPVLLKPTVELIRGAHTSDDTVAGARTFLESIGKRSVLVKDSPGFVSNRVLMLTINEAAFLVHEGVASAEGVDQIFRECFGHPMGPLATADLIGIDTILQSVEVLQDEFADSKYRPCPLLKEMVSAGWNGRKSGRGFFVYT